MMNPAMLYGTNITLKAVDLNVYLHSHRDRYPLRYKDDRVSSQGQQVTGYPHPDANNFWQLIPADGVFTKADGTPREVKHDEHIRLLHCMTNGFLVTHDVASSLTATNMEMTIEPNHTHRVDATTWVLGLENGKADTVWKSITHNLRLTNLQHSVAIHPYKLALPDWGFGQQEINGNKAVEEKGNLWLAEDIVLMPNGRIGETCIRTSTDIT